MNAVSADGIFEDTDGSLKVLLPSDSDGHTLTVTQIDERRRDIHARFARTADVRGSEPIRIVAYGGSNRRSASPPA